MKPVTVEQLYDAISSNLSRRKKDITAFGFLLERGRTHEKPLLRRLGLVLLCAHLEGFLKEASKTYLSHVAVQNCPKMNLNPGLLAAATKSQLIKFRDVSRPTLLADITSAFLQELDSDSVFSWSGELDTHSNPNMDTILDVLGLLGIDATGYVTKKHILNETLIPTRGKVAHRGMVEVDAGTYEQCKTVVLTLLESLATDITNHAAARKYIRGN